MKIMTERDIRIVQLGLMQTQDCSLATLNKAKTGSIGPLFTTFNSPSLTAKTGVRECLRVREGPNSNLQGLAWALLHSAYSPPTRYRLLNFLQSAIYSRQTDPSEFKGLGGSVTGQMKVDEVKKVMADFFFEMQYSAAGTKVESKLNKYPIVLELLALTLRGLLAEAGVKDSLNYSLAVSTPESFKVLAIHFDLNLEKKEYLYFLH